MKKTNINVPDDATIDWWISDQIENRLTKGDIETIQELESSSEMLKFHFTVGMSIRNVYGLWAENGLTKHFNSLGIHHADDMSSILLEALWHKIHDKPYNPEPTIQRFKTYWENIEKDSA